MKSFPKGRPNPTQRCKRFATASKSTHAAVLPWCFGTEMGTANSLHASAIMKGLGFWFGFDVQLDSY